MIINNKLKSTLAAQVGAAAVKAGLPASSIGGLLEAMATGSPAAFEAVKGLNPAVLGAAMNASQHAYAAAYRLAWASIIPFVVLAIVCVACLKGVKELMTERVEATVEHVSEVDQVKA